MFLQIDIDIDIVNVNIYVDLRACAYIRVCVHTCTYKYNGTPLLRSPTGLGKCDLNGEVTLLQGVICIAEYNLGLSQGDCNGEVFLLVR